MASSSNTRAPPTARGPAITSSTSGHIKLFKTYEAGNTSGTTALDPLAVDIVTVYATNGSKDGSVFESSRLSDKKSQNTDLRPNSQQVNTPKGKATDQAKAAETVLKGTNWLEDENMLRSRLTIWRILECRLVFSREQSQRSAVSLDVLASELTNILRNQISNLGERPIAFIGHGYGTLLIQKMMLRQKEYPEKLKDATAAVVFFATPISMESDSQVDEWAANVYGLGLRTNNESPAPLDVVIASNSWKEFQDFTSNWNMMSLQFDQAKKKKEDMQDKDARQDKNSMGEANQIASAVEDQKSGKLKQTIKSEEEGRQTTLDNAHRQKNEFQLGDEVWPRDCALRDIATIPGPFDPSFHKLVNFLVKSIQTNLLLEASVKQDKKKLTEVASHCTHLNHANRLGETALQVAVKRQEQDIVEFLLSTGKVEPNQLNGLGSTALHLVLQSEGKFIGAIVEKLLSYGADPTIADKNDEVPSDLAQRLMNDLTEGKSSKATEQVEQLKEAKQHLDNPPPVLTVRRMRRLIKQRPPKSSIAFEACKRTIVTIREMFKLDQYIPLYKDVAELLYPDEPFPRTELAEIADSAVGQVQKDGYNSQLNGHFTSRREKTSLNNESAFCRWFHIPMNNMAWVHDLFATLDCQVWPWPQDYRDYELPFSRVVYPQISRLKPLKDSDSSLKVHAIMMPYLSYEECTRQHAVNNLVRNVSIDTQKRYQRSASRFTDNFGIKAKWLQRLTGSHHHADREYRLEDFHRFILMMDKEEDEKEIPDSTRKAVTGYLNYNHTAGYECCLPLHPRRTLDQSYYYTLQDTSFRDKTQVASRHFRRSIRSKDSSASKTPDYGGYYEDLTKVFHDHEIERKKHNILMIDQLWLWVIECNDAKSPDTIITSFPDRKGAEASVADNIQKQILDDQSKMPSQDIWNFVGKILSTCCKTLDSNQDVNSLNFLQSFESSIAHVEEESTQQFQKFRLLSVLLQKLDEKHPGYQNRRRVLLNKLLDINHESQCLTEVKDILDEIKIIQTTLDEQLNLMKRSALELTWSIFETAKYSVQRTKGMFVRLQERAQDAESSIQNLLDLKQKQASLWEARTSREGAEETARQGNTLLVFTVVTVIFLPLSFMASFFALDIDSFPKDNAGNTNWPLNTLSAFLFGISFAVAIPFAFLAFYVQSLKRIWGRVQHFWFRIIALILLHPLTNLPKVGERFDSIWEDISENLKMNKHDSDYKEFLEQLLGDEADTYSEIDEDLKYFFENRWPQFRFSRGQTI